MVLTLDQIKPYDRNPRRERNPRYDEIKASIRAQGGLNNPLTVTRRSGDDRYMVESGGNTRLAILNALFKETGDESFYRLHVLYRPWRSETHVLAAHLIENEQRGEIHFIDKALAVRELKDLFEVEDNGHLSLRQLTTRLKETGYAVDASVISRMDYAVDVLLPLIPEALRAGMGKPQIARIRRIEKAFHAYWTAQSGQDSETFTALFHDALSEHNRPEWESDALRITLEERFAELLEIPVRSMRLDIDALLNARSLEINTASTSPLSLPDTDPATEDHSETRDRAETPVGPALSQENEPSPTPSATDAPTAHVATGAAQSENVADEQPSVAPIAQPVDSEYDQPTDAEPLDLTLARQNLYELAQDPSGTLPVRALHPSLSPLGPRLCDRPARRTLGSGGNREHWAETALGGDAAPVDLVDALYLLRRNRPPRANS